MSLTSRIASPETKSISQRLPFTQQHGMQYNGVQLTNSMQQQLQAYGSVGWLFAVVNRIATGVAMNEWDVIQDAKGPPVRVPEHPLAHLWEYINPFYTRDELIIASEQHFQLVGEAWWVLLTDEKNGMVKEIWPVRPDKMSIQKSNTEYISGYWYHHGSTKIPLAVEDVVHFRNPDPNDDYRGRGAVQAILADVEGEKYASLWNRNFFINSAQPGGIIEFEENLSREEFDELVLRWREQHQGVSNAHRVAIIEGGTWKDMKYTQRDMQFGDLRRVNRDAILGAYGVPMPVLGITEAVNRANAESGEYLFAKWTVKPALRRYKSKINDKISKRFGDNVYLDFKDPVPPDPTVNLKTATDGYKEFILTLDEARKLLGENPVVGGNHLVDGTPVTIIAPDTFHDNGKSMTYRIKTIDGGALIPEDFSTLWFSIFMEEASDIVKYLDVLHQPNSDPFAALADKMIEATGAFSKFSSTDLDRYNWDWETRYGAKIQEALEREFIEEFRDVLESGLIQPSDVIINAIASGYANSRMIEILSSVGTLSVVQNTKDRIRKMLEENSNLSLSELKEKIINDYIFSVARARTVARTEISYIRGMAVYRAGALQGKSQKRWITSGTSTTEDCLKNEAQGWIGITEMFKSGDYTTPNHPNCECILETQIGDDQTLVIIEERRSVEAEIIRCPNDGHRLPISGIKGTATIFCRHCKQEVTIEG